MTLSPASQKVWLPHTRHTAPRRMLSYVYSGVSAHISLSAWILFVVQNGERNVFDQRWLEYELLEKCVLR